jgi:hypothetical protein
MSKENLGIEALAGVGGLSAGVLELLGIPLQPIVYGLIGGVIGAGLAKPARWYIAIPVYLASSIIAAQFGFTAAEVYANGGASAANAFSAGIALVFHPALAAIAGGIPALRDKLISLIGAGGTK